MRLQGKMSEFQLSQGICHDCQGGNLLADSGGEEDVERCIVRTTLSRSLIHREWSMASTI